jgi:hypothetical protein
MTNFVPDVVGKEPLTPAVVVTPFEVEMVLEVVTGGLVTTVVEDNVTDALVVDVLMVVETLNAAPGTHCE